MGSVKTVWAVCAQNLRKWATDYRMWTIAALLIIMVQIYVDDIQKVAGLSGTSGSIWIFPFLYVQFHTKVIFTLPVVLMFCNAPFTDKNHIFVIRVPTAQNGFGDRFYTYLSQAPFIICLYYSLLLFQRFL